MRTTPYITQLWDAGGPFTGEDGKPHSRVFVQLPWDDSDADIFNGNEDHVIHPTNSLGVGKSVARGVPLRFFQKEDNSQSMMEVPNVKVVSIDRSIEQDAASCNITLYNQWMYGDGEVPPKDHVRGNTALSGYFTPIRGLNMDAVNRWGHEVNDWNQVLTANTILRTYQGYGGHGKSLQDCLDDGNLVLTGVWLIDETRIATNGEMEIICRDMAKLLIEQQLFPPLVPRDKYPLTYYRWVYDNFAVRAAARRTTSTTDTRIAAGDKRAVFRDSSTDRWYPGQTGSGGYTLHGHKGSHSLDGNTSTYWLSVGNSGPTRAFATDWIEYDCGEHMNAVYIHPWAGNYACYISVMEDGAWQGTSTVPYDPSELYGSQPRVVDTGANIPYVKKVGIPWERGTQIVLPRAYHAQRVRISFRNLAYSGIGPWYYRAGVREFRIRATTSAGSVTTSSTLTVQPLFNCADAIWDIDEVASGYVTCSQHGQIDAFGDARRLARTGGDTSTSEDVGWIELIPHHLGLGYYTQRYDGSITAYGAASFHGSPKQDGRAYGDTYRWAAVCVTHTGQGYWAINWDGRIANFGDAPAYSGVTVPTGQKVFSACSLHHDYGLWLMLTDGDVHVRGAATHYGNFTEATLSASALDFASYIVGTSTDEGYWMLTTRGRVQAFGDAEDHGQIDALTTSTSMFERYLELLPASSDDGYLILKGRGNIYPVGEVDYFGSPIPGSTGQIRSPGNYTDFADIVKDLALWSGFLLYDRDLPPTSDAPVFGNVESTGMWSQEQLPDDMFDKRPVIDAITQLKESVGYIVFVDDEGGFRFHTPNWWAPGNFLQETGEHVAELMEVDEQINLINYSISNSDENLRSKIIIASEDPTEQGDSTVTTSLIPQSASGLKGLIKPAMWVNGYFQDENEQLIMAELIAMHIWFSQRIGQATIPANPAIQIDDQIRIFERQTAEAYIHYVRGVSSTHDLDSGSYTMTLTTHWLGTGDNWVIEGGAGTVGGSIYDTISLSDRLLIWATEAGARAGQTLERPDDDVTTEYGTDPNGPFGPPDAGQGDDT